MKPSLTLTWLRRGVLAMQHARGVTSDPSARQVTYLGSRSARRRSTPRSTTSSAGGASHVHRDEGGLQGATEVFPSARRSMAARRPPSQLRARIDRTAKPVAIVSPPPAPAVVAKAAPRRAARRRGRCRVEGCAGRRAGVGRAGRSATCRHTWRYTPDFAAQGEPQSVETERRRASQGTSGSRRCRRSARSTPAASLRAPSSSRAMRRTN